MSLFPNGTYTVLVTPFTSTNIVDYNSIRKWLSIQYANKEVVGLVLLGTTSESPTLKTAEKIEIVKNVFFNNYMQKPQDRKMIIAGVGGNDTNDVISFANEIKYFVDAFMVTVPYYNKPQQRGIYQHFKIISDEFYSMPIMMYNVPSRCGVNMEPETIIQIIKSVKNVVGLKETNLNNAQKLEILARENDIEIGVSFKMFSGDDANIVDYCKFGGSGVISVASNVIPNQITSVVKKCLDKNYQDGETELGRLSKFLSYLFVESNPVPVKDLMFRLNIYGNNLMRLPLVPLESDKSDNLLNLYDEIKEI